jgi:hypothetical protein
MCTYTCTHIHTHMHTHTHAYKHRTRRDTHTRTHTQTHTRTRTHTHTGAHLPVCKHRPVVAVERLAHKRRARFPINLCVARPYCVVPLARLRRVHARTQCDAHGGRTPGHRRTSWSSRRPASPGPGLGIATPARGSSSTPVRAHNCNVDLQETAQNRATRASPHHINQRTSTAPAPSSTSTIEIAPADVSSGTRQRHRTAT